MVMGFRFPAFGLLLGLSLLGGSVSSVLSCGKVVKNSFNFTLSSNHVEVNVLLFCKYFDQFLFSSDLILILDFLNIVRLLLEYCILFGGNSFFFP